MARYIDADKLESELFRDGIAGIFLNYPRRVKFTIGEIRGMLKNERIAPTADVVEVVRCKDCEWYQESNLLAPNKFCFRLKHPTEDRKIGYNYAPDDFCSYGEKRSDTE